MAKSMLNTTKLFLLSSLLFTQSFIASPFVLADTKGDLICGANSAASGDCATQPTGSLDDTIANVINILSILVGIAAVVMIIIGGLRYITSGGNPEGAKKARTTILYAIAGLVIAVLAQVIARFVLKKTTS